MPTLQEQLLDIEKKEAETEDMFSKFRKINRYLSFTNTLRYLFSYLIILVVVSLFFYFLEKDFFSWKTAWTIFIFSIYPGIAFISLIADLLEKFFECLAYKLARIDRAEFYTTQLKLNSIKEKKSSICKQIIIEKVRIQKEINKEIENKLKEINKEIESKFIFKLNDAVYNIENRKINLIEAEQLQSQLEKDFRTIKSNGLYWYTAKYYNNRFEKIATALKNYDVTNIPTERPFTIAKTDNLDKTLEPTVTKPTEIKVERFSPSYKPVANTETILTTSDKPIDKTVEPTIPKPTETKVEPFTPVYKPVAKTEIPITTKSEPWWNPEKKETFSPLADKIVMKQNESIIIAGKEKSIEELFQKKNDSASNQPNQKRDRQPTKVDYVKLNEQRKIIGMLGEKFALNYENERLVEKGLSKYLNDIQHVSISDDSFGYDIKSFNEDGSARYIEVKTTTDDHKSPFYITENEITAMDNLNSYFIYRIYNFDISIEIGKMLIIDCNTELEKYFEISPVSYRVSPK